MSFGGDSMFNEQLLLLCKQENTSISAVAQELGFSTGSIANWKRGKIPNGDTLLKFANYFHVSTDYLLTGKINCDTISNDEKEWILLYRKLSAYDSNLIKESNIYIEGLLKGYQIHP